MDNSNKVPTNHELVDALINDFKATCDINPNDESKNETEPSVVSIEEDQSDDEENAEEEKPKPEDYIDEEELQTRDKNLTVDDLQRLKAEAEDLKGKGNEQFKNKEFVESAGTYTTALRTCPLAYPKERSILYANRGAAKIKLELTESAIEDCSRAIDLEPNYMKALLRRAQMYEAIGKLDEALEDFQKIVEIDPSHSESLAACQRLQIQINEREEKLKTEMFGKLKDLGDVILRPFGLSTNNFQMVQDPESGGYSISFKKN